MQEQHRNARNMVMWGVALVALGIFLAGLQWTRCTFSPFPDVPDSPEESWKCVEGEWKTRFVSTSTERLGEYPVTFDGLEN